jgi:hypothetical protein
VSEDRASAPGRRAAARRLIAALITLAAIDLFVPSWVARAARAR